MKALSRKKIFSTGFLAGCLLTTSLILGLELYFQDPGVNIELVEQDKREALVNYLDANEISYEYKIDSFKRHWIKPIVRDEETFDEIDKFIESLYVVQGEDNQDINKGSK